MSLFQDKELSVLAIEGVDRFKLLQGLITQDVAPLEAKQKKVIYTAMLSPQGRYLFDFFVLSHEDTLFVVGYNVLQLYTKLLTYQLRLDVQLNMIEAWKVYGDLNSDALLADSLSFQDPRLDGLCHWYITPHDLPTTVDKEAYILRCYNLGVPNTYDLTQDKSIILEWNFEELNGISFKKGCYMGQELMSRTKHVGKIRKRIFSLVLDAEVDPKRIIGEDVMFDDETIGNVLSFLKNKGLAMIRVEKLNNINNKNNLPVAVLGIKGIIKFSGCTRNEG